VKQKIVEYRRSDRYTEFGDLQVRKIETVDGYKYYLDKEEWGMIRPSGTEPVLRTDAESSTTGGAFKVLEKTHQAINP
jgi:phosphomannomutase